MARFDVSRRLPAAIAFTLVSACSGGKPEAPAPTPAAGHATAGTAVRAMTVPALEGFETAVGRGTRTRTGVPGPRYWQQWADYKLSAELNPVSKRMTGHGHHHLLQPLARHPPYRLRPAAAEHLRARRPPQHERPVVRRGHRARQGGRAGHHARGERRRGPRLRGERHDHADPAAEAARAGRHGRPRVRLEAPRAARRRAAWRPGRRGLLHELLVPADGGVRRRQRLADRPVPRQRRVLHGLRQLRREPHACRPAGWSTATGTLQNPDEVLTAADPRAARLGADAPPASCTW